MSAVMPGCEDWKTVHRKLITYICSIQYGVSIVPGHDRYGDGGRTVIQYENRRATIDTHLKLSRPEELILIPFLDVILDRLEEFKKFEDVR